MQQLDPTVLPLILRQALFVLDKKGKKNPNKRKGVNEWSKKRLYLPRFEQKRRVECGMSDGLICVEKEEKQQKQWLRFHSKAKSINHEAIF